MSDDIYMAIDKLVKTLADHHSVRAVGWSGGERPFPEAGEGDIDLFVYCTEIPFKDERKEMLRSLESKIKQIEVGKLEGGHWGQGDCFLLAGVETWLLYFTIAEACTELEAILNGECLGRADSYYYPIGRCAMWKTMRVLYDPDSFLRSIKEHLADYPPALALAVIDHHLKALEDVEDLERAVGRKDVLFFHFAMDLALDHFLQALFTVNREYFPSRKRSLSYIRHFQVKPADCEERLLQIVVFGGKAETLEQSYEGWKNLVQDLKLLVGDQD